MHWHGHLPQVLEYKQKKKTWPFPLVFVLESPFPLKNLHIFVVLGCPEQRIKELSNVRLVIQAMSHLVARWGEVAEESRFATWKRLLDDVGCYHEFPGEEICCKISRQFLLATWIAVKLPATCSTPKNPGISSYPRWILYHSGKLTGQMKHPQFQ